MQQVLGWVETGLLAPRVHAAYPLAEIAEAIAVLDDRRAIGKVVIDMTA